MLNATVWYDGDDWGEWTFEALPRRGDWVSLEVTHDDGSMEEAEGVVSRVEFRTSMAGDKNPASQRLIVITVEKEDG